MVRSARRIAAAALVAGALLAAGAGTASAAPADEPRVQWVVTKGGDGDLSTMAPGDMKEVLLFVDDVHRGTVQMVSHTGGYWDLYVCDAENDGWNMTARIDPGDGRILVYADEDANPYVCYNRDIWYDVRKFRGAWNGYATQWLAPPPL